MSASMPSAGWNDVRAKPSGKFEARWAQPSEEDPTVWVPRALTFTTKEQAKKHARTQAQYYEDIKAGVRTQDIGIESALERFLSRAGIMQATSDDHGRNIRWMIETFDVTHVSQLTADLMDRICSRLQRDKPTSTGGQRHVLKSIRAFCRYCVDEKKWLAAFPFSPKWRLPKQSREGRPLAPAEFDAMTTIRTHVGCVESDTWMRRWLILQRYTMTRISTIYELTAADFRNDGTEMFIDTIKNQERAWVELTHPAAIAVARELLSLAVPGERLFRHWKRIRTMREAFRTKAIALGLSGVRPHDACKVTEVTALDARGVSLGQISQVSNTSAITLAKHYLKPDRKIAFDRVRALYAGQTTDRPQNQDISGQNRGTEGGSGVTGTSGGAQSVDGK